jgi:3-hydroxyacyl-[acyl-carrier-protein] dehydratase
MRLEYFEMVDRIEELDLEANTVRASCVVPQESSVFEGHFPGHPILPGVLMIEAMAQTGGWLVMAKLEFQRMAFLASVKEAKMRRFLVPGQALTTEATLLHDGSGYAVVQARILSEGRTVADAEITYRVLPFPNAVLRASMLKAAARVSVPAALLADVKELPENG